MRIGLLLFVLIILQSCSSRTNNQDEWDENNLIGLAVDDPYVLRAKKTAQDSLNVYMDYFNNFYGKENYRFYLKKTFEDQGEFEHMWSRPFEISEAGFNRSWIMNLKD